jgi:ferric-dicitrate binding protein FerR (iron transport regulator)
VARRILAFLSVFLLPGQPAEAGGTVVGIITTASSAHIDSGLASDGASIYSGDHLSTEAQGFLRIRIGLARIYLAEESSITLEAASNGTRAVLGDGSLAFSSSVADSFEVLAYGASIRPAANVPTVAEVKTLGANELFVTAKRGALALSFRDENRILQEGQSYRITLDASSEAPAAASNRTPPKNGRKKMIIKVVALATIGGVTAWVLHEAFESPDRP